MYKRQTFPPLTKWLSSKDSIGNKKQKRKEKKRKEKRKTSSLNANN